jgi:hypothetical protein
MLFLLFLKKRKETLLLECLVKVALNAGLVFILGFVSEEQPTPAKQRPAAGCVSLSVRREQGVGRKGKVRAGE